MRGILTVGLVCCLCGTTALAGAKVEIDDVAKIDVGFRVQALALQTETDLDGDGAWDSEQDFKIRRGRLRLGADINEWIGAKMQTEIGSGVDGSGYDMRVIDALISLKADDLCQIIVGENMSPASRQNLTSSGAPLTMDRPGMNYKTLTWGCRSVYAFANKTLPGTDSGLRGEVDVRDLGATVFGSTSISEGMHCKYYAGIYDGIQRGTMEDDERYTARVQMNIGDAEAGYYNSATYVGAKKTLAIGASYDMQDNVALSDDVGAVDYEFYTVDVFAEQGVGDGTLTLEAAYEHLTLGNAEALDSDGNAETAGVNARQAEGDGYYVQAGFLMGQWQPWVGYESWSSDADDDAGSYDLYRGGVSYYVKGHNASIKAGYERVDADVVFPGTTEDSVDTYMVGCYVTY